MYAHLPWVLGTNCTLFAGPIPLFVALSLDSALEICWRILELGGLTAPIFVCLHRPVVCVLAAQVSFGRYDTDGSDDVHDLLVYEDVSTGKLGLRDEDSSLGGSPVVQVVGCHLLHHRSVWPAGLEH